VVEHNGKKYGKPLIEEVLESQREVAREMRKHGYNREMHNQFVRGMKIPKEFCPYPLEEEDKKDGS